MSPASTPTPDESFDFDSENSITQSPHNKPQKPNPFATMQTIATRPSKRKRSAVNEIPETPWNPQSGDNRHYSYSYNGKPQVGEREREILVGRFGSMKLCVPEKNGAGAGLKATESAVMFDGGNEARDFEMDEAGEETKPTIKRRRDGSENKPTANVVPPEDGDGDMAVQLPSPPREASDVRGQGPGHNSSKRLRSPPPPVEPPPSVAEEEVDQYGIAYVPTPAQRYARSQKRLQQVGFVFLWFVLEWPTDKCPLRRSRNTSPVNRETPGKRGLPREGGGRVSLVLKPPLLSPPLRPPRSSRRRRRRCISIYDYNGMMFQGLFFFFLRESLRTAHGT